MGTSWMLLLASCGGGSDGGTAPPAGASDAQLAVSVHDSLGRMVAGATVRTAAGTAVTDAKGAASLRVPTGSEQALAIEKSGFAEQVKVVKLAAGTTTASLQAMLIAREAPLVIAANEIGGTASGKDGVKVTLQPGALVTSGGAAVTGPVQLSLTPVDVTQLDVGAFPGLFEGISGGARTAILSFGTAELVPQQSGQKLQLAAGRSAEIELPLYVRKHQDGSDVKAGDKIALWSLDATTGLWKQEGEGTVVLSAGSPTGFVLRATITHFSWWNVDVSSGRGFVTLTVNVPGRTVPPGTPAAIKGQVVAGSGPTSVATTTTTVGVAVTVQAPAGSTTRLSARVELSDAICSGSVDVSPPRDATINATIDATCVDVPVPRITRPGPLSTTNSSRDVAIAVLVDGPRADRVEVFAGSTRIADFDATVQVQPFFTAFFASSGFAEGTYEIKARATREGISRDSVPVRIVVDRTPPRMTDFTPTPATEVDRDTVFTVTFDEPVNPLPFTLASAVRFAVAPPGGAPAELPITASLDASGMLLTVRPQAALPIGTASLTWGGLKDAAENNITGTISVAWNVARSARLGDDFGTDFAPDLPMVLDAGGNAHVLQRLPNRSGLQVLRFNGSGFVPVGPQVSQREVGDRYSLAIDASGVLYTAFEQRDGGGSNFEVLVRRFDAASGSWQTLVAPFATGSASPAWPSMVIDASNRPVLAFIGAGFVAQGHRFDGTAWTPLGAIANNVFGNSATGLTLALNGNGRPLVAYMQGFPGSNGAELRVKEYDGTGWVALGGVLDATPNATATVFMPQIAIAGDGRPWLAWHGTSGGSTVKLARFDGSAFVAVPIDPALTSFNGVVGLTFLNGDVVVAGGGAFGAGTIDVRRLRGSTWEPATLVATPGIVHSVQLRPGSGNTVLIGMCTGASLGRLTRLAFP